MTCNIRIVRMYRSGCFVIYSSFVIFIFGVVLCNFALTELRVNRVFICFAFETNLSFRVAFIAHC